MASGGSSGRASSGPRAYDFSTDDVLCSYDDFTNQDPNGGKRSDPSRQDFHENRTGRSLVNVYGQQDEYPKEEIMSAVEKCVKKYVDNLLQQLEGISGRLSQLEIYCYKLERSVGELRADVISSVGELRADVIQDNSEADTKLKSLEKHLQEVHRSIQILRDKQELAETQKELTKLHFTPKESSTTSHSQKIEEASASSSSHESKTRDDTQETPNQHLALALPHQIPSSRAPDHNQFPVQPPQQPQPPPASLSAPQDPYVMSQQISYYTHQNQPVQHDQQYVQHRPQIQQPPLPPPQQSLPVNQAQPPQQPYPQYHQHWTQPPQQQPPSQAQLVRPHTPPVYPSYNHPTQPAVSNPETSYSDRVQTAPVRFSYGPSGSSVNIPTQPQHPTASLSSSGPAPPKTGAYVSPSPYPPQGYSTMYNMDGARVQAYQLGGYDPPSNTNQLGGFPQMMRSHPYADMIEKAVSMGYPMEQVAAAVNRLAESGQPVDFNALLDRLNSAPASGGAPRVWLG